MNIPLSKKTFFFLVFFFLFLGGALFFQFSRISFFEKEKIMFFNLPGEAILILGKNGEKILVDTGENEKTTKRLLEIFPFWNRHIHALFLTHFDSDHAGGASSILQNFSVDVIFTTGAFKKSLSFQDLQKTISEKKIPFISLNAIKDVQIGKIIFDTLSPQESAFGKIDEKNQFMLSGRIVIEGKSFLLTGDMDKSLENNILFSPQKIKSDVLKVAHHGSKTSSSDLFLKAGNFKKAIIIAAEKNRFGHPHSEVLDRLIQNNIPFFQTGKTGEIMIPSL